MSEKCCGTCGWSEEMEYPGRVRCRWVCPYKSLPVVEYSRVYRLGEGRDCPCWKPKE